MGSDLDHVLTFVHLGSKPFAKHPFHAEIKANPEKCIPHYQKYLDFIAKYRKHFTFGTVTNNENSATSLNILRALLGKEINYRIISGFLADDGSRAFYLKQGKGVIDENRKDWQTNACALNLETMMLDLNLDLEKIVQCWKNSYPNMVIGKNLHIIIQAVEWNAEHNGRILSDFILIDDSIENIMAAEELPKFLKKFAKELGLPQLADLRVHTIHVGTKPIPKSEEYEIADYFPQYEALLQKILATPAPDKSLHFSAPCYKSNLVYFATIFKQLSNVEEELFHLNLEASHQLQHSDFTLMCNSLVKLKEDHSIIETKTQNGSSHQKKQVPIDTLDLGILVETIESLVGDKAHFESLNPPINLPQSAESTFALYFGVFLFETIMGRNIESFKENSQKIILGLRVIGKVEDYERYLDECPLGIQDLIRDCFAEDPQNRPCFSTIRECLAASFEVNPTLSTLRELLKGGKKELPPNKTVTNETKSEPTTSGSPVLQSASLPLPKMMPTLAHSQPMPAVAPLENSQTVNLMHSLAPAQTEESLQYDSVLMRPPSLW